MEIRFCEEVPEIKTEIFNNGRKATVNLYRMKKLEHCQNIPTIILHHVEEFIAGM